MELMEASRSIRQGSWIEGSPRKREKNVMIYLLPFLTTPLLDESFPLFLVKDGLFMYVKPRFLHGILQEQFYVKKP